MPKKSTKKSTQGVAEGTVVEEEKKASTTKRSGNEIEDIFAGKKRKKPDEKKAKKPAGEVEASKTDDKVKKKNKKKQSKKSDDVNDFADPPSRLRKRTGDGLAVYSEEELGIGKSDAGGTPLCPFDCDCCF